MDVDGPAPLAEQEEKTFFVHKIINRRYDDDGAAEYQVECEGFPEAEDRSWEPRQVLEEGAPDLLRDYEALHPLEADATKSGRKLKRQRPNYEDMDSDIDALSPSPDGKKRARPEAAAGDRQARMDTNPNPNSSISAEGLLKTL